MKFLAWRGGWLAALLTHPLTAWAGFMLVHLILGYICLTHPSLPMGDVTMVYRFWVQYGFETGTWVGIDTVWVYPILALVPMLAAGITGWDFYGSMWLSLAMAVNALAFAFILHGRGTRGRLAAWWWIAFLLLAGPVTLGRIDVFATAVAIIGILFVFARPWLAGVLLTVSAWLKVWPAALVAGAVVLLRGRLALGLGATVVTLAVLLLGVMFGGGISLLSFLGAQTGRGLQIESVFATVGMWFAAGSGETEIYYDRDILTYQLRGPGIELLAKLSTPLLIIATLALILIGTLAFRRAVKMETVFPQLALAITTVLIVFNKVGSPQFAGWLAVPIIVGIIYRPRVFRTPALLALLLGALTQATYPYLYGKLLELEPTMIGILSIRNALYLALFIWALIGLIRLTNPRVSQQQHRKILTESLHAPGSR